MINVQTHINKLEQLKLKFQWFLDGVGVHCLPLKFVGTPIEIISQNYNVELKWFKQNDKN